MIEGIKIQHIKVFQGKEGPERLQTERPVEQAERLETDRPLITDPRSSQVELTKRQPPKTRTSDLQMRPSAE